MPTAQDVVTVKAGGRLYRSWRTIMVRREFGDTISYFQLTASEDAKDAFRLVPGMPVQIYLGNVLALTGAVTTRNATFDGSNHDLVVGGRSGTQDAADSSVNIKPGNLNGYTLEQASRSILQPHGIGLRMVNPPAIVAKAFPFLAVTPGETGIAMIERLARMRGCFMWDDVQGNLCLGQHNPGAAVIADLQEGRNILRGSFKLDDQDIFGSLSIYGQQPSTDDNWPARAAQATVSDAGARPNRTKVLPAEHPGENDDMVARANLEAARTAWPTVDVSVTVSGWHRADGKLWDILNNVSVYSPMGLPNRDGKMTLGIQALTFGQDEDGGSITTLDLKRPELLTSLPHTSVQTNGSGGFVDNPSPATAVSPDWASQPAVGHPV